MPPRKASDFPTVKLAILLGLGEWGDSRWRRYQRAYKLLVFVALLSQSILRFLQLRSIIKSSVHWNDFLFEPGGQLVMLNGMFFMSGAMGSLLLHLIHSKDEILFKDLENRNDAESFRRCFIVMIASVTYSFIVGISGILAFQLQGQDNIPPLFYEGPIWRALEFYLYFVCQNAVNLIVASFYQSMAILKRKIKDLQAAMEWKDGRLMPVEDTISRLKWFQKLHFDVVFTKETLQRQYDVPLFYVYAISIPALCFMAYLFLKNIRVAPSMLIPIAVWMSTNLGALFVMSYSAFAIHEEGEKLVTSSLRMYSETVSSHSNLTLISYTTLLLHQIHATKLTLSAWGYFDLRRRILLTLFSTILTNFLILVQFSNDQWF